MLSKVAIRPELPEALCRRMLRPTWVEVDLDAIEHNVTTVKRMARQHPPGIHVICGSCISAATCLYD